MAPTSPDFSDLPVNINRTLEPRAPKAIAAIVGFCGATVVAHSFDLWDSTWLGPLLLVVLSAIFLPLFVGLSLVFQADEESITFTEATVSANGIRNAGGRRAAYDWTAPIGEYRSVRWKFDRKVKKPDHVVELVHQFSDKTVVLYAGGDRRRASDVWTSAGKALELPTEEVLVKGKPHEHFHVYAEADNDSTADGEDGSDGGGNGG